MHYKERYHKLLELLNSNEKEPMEDAVLLIATEKDINLIKMIWTERHYIDFINYRLVPFFQKNPAIYEFFCSVLSREDLVSIEQWMSCDIIPLWKETYFTEAFFFFHANQFAQKYLAKDFPIIDASIIQSRENIWSGKIEKGEIIDNAIGWSFEKNLEEYGPAYNFEAEEWKAIAHYPEFSLEIVLKSVSRSDDWAKGWAKKLPK